MISKPWHILALIAFALTCIYIVNVVTGMTYSNEGSFDVVTGAFVETFILAVFFEYFNSRQQKKTEKHLQDHLRKVEEMIKNVGE
jgi:hypothetical protein